MMLANDVLLREVDLGQVTDPRALWQHQVEKTGHPHRCRRKAQLRAKTFQKASTYVEGFIILTDAEERRHPGIQVSTLPGLLRRLDRRPHL
ncbi:MAG: hypothetical protein ACLU9S_24040 [Oscillospiraceae bacterium]